MKEQKLERDEIKELLTPLITKMECCSVSALKNDSSLLTERIKKAGGLITLTHHGKPIALLCDPIVYEQTDQKRRRLEALLVSVSSTSTSVKFIPTVGRRPMMPSEHQNLWKLREYIHKIEKLQSRINLLKCNFYEMEEQLQETIEKERKLLPTIKPVSLASRVKPANF